MKALNLPKYDFKIISKGNSYEIFDIIRKKYIKLTPEEWVRQNFIMYLIIDKKYKSAYSGLISLAAGISVVESLKKRGVETKLKWPNDIFASDKKIAGILCESRILKNKIEKIIIGIGINVNETILEHPENLHDHLTTMFEISNHAHQRELIVAEFINSIERQLYYFASDSEQIINEWMDNCMHLNESISFFDNGKIIEGIFCGLDNDGLAKIYIHDEIKTYSSINII